MFAAYVTCGVGSIGVAITYAFLDDVIFIIMDLMGLWLA